MAELHQMLAGEITLRPGLACPSNVISTRPDWVNRLAPGIAAASLPGMLANVFSSCGEAHRLCASLALDAARGSQDAVEPTALQRLQAETLREHVRRITLDWPRRLCADAQGSSALAASAVASLRMAAALPGMSLDEWMLKSVQTLAWLEREWLGVPAQQWLDAWQRSPREWLEEWSEGQAGWLPQLLLASKRHADVICSPAPALRVHAGVDSLHRFSQQLDSGVANVREPQWHGVCAQTGAWTRLCEAAPDVYDTPWLRLGARLAECVRLAQPGARRLGAARVSLGKGSGLAWVEMARGLLMHRVTLDGERVARCDVIAPTEWNFHPSGAVAKTLETVNSDDNDRIIALMTAYDPCVNYRIEKMPRDLEAAHA